MKAPCAAAWCPNNAHARGLCVMHYQRWKRHGTAHPTPEQTKAGRKSGAQYNVKVRGPSLLERSERVAQRIFDRYGGEPYLYHGSVRALLAMAYRMGAKGQDDCERHTPTKHREDREPGNAGGPGVYVGRAGAAGAARCGVPGCTIVDPPNSGHCHGSGGVTIVTLGAVAGGTTFASLDLDTKS